MAVIPFTRRSFLAFPFAATAFARRWDEPQFPDWDQKFIDALLTDSPWARTWKGTAVQPVKEQRPLISSRFASQLGIDLPPLPRVGGMPRSPRGPSAPQGGGEPIMLRIAVELTVRWASALPIRRALALQSFGAHGLGKPGAKAMLEGPENRDIVIDLAGIPHVLMTKELEDDLAKTMLTLPGRRGTTASSVEVPTIGNLLTARLRFPRVGGLNPDAGSAEVSLNSGPLRFREEFKLRSMVYEGRLEL